jgi:hypothetical protein
MHMYVSTCGCTGFLKKRLLQTTMEKNTKSKANARLEKLSKRTPNTSSDRVY